MASQVKYTNLFSESRNNVTALLTTTNVPDSTISSAENRKRIYSREPDTKDSNFAGFPYMVVHPSNFKTEKKGGSLDGKSKFVSWDIEIEVVTSDRGYSGKAGTGAADMDTYSNKISTTFMNKTNRDTLSNNSMKFSDIDSGDAVPVPLHNELTFRRSILLSFMSRIQVSA